MPEITLEVNGRKVQGNTASRTHLGDFLREELRLTGTNLSCEHGVCGACTVLMDGKPVRSCITFAAAAQGSCVTTIEGYEDDPVMGKLRQAFSAHHALQCGFCTPGMLATSRDIVLRLPDADEKRVRIELSGNICRCTGYQGITAAVMSVLQDLRDTRDDEIEALRAAVAQGKGAAPVQVAAETFKGFAAATVDAAPEDAAKSTPATEPAPAGAADKGRVPGKGTQVSGGFEVAYPADEVWAFMTDLERVAACLPGAVIESNDGQRVQGRIAIKFGPMSAAFKGSADLELNPQDKSAVLSGAGQDTVSQSRARGDVAYRVVATGEAKSRVDVDLLYSLQGPLAQFSRSGLVQDFVKRMIADFGRNVSQRLGKPDDGSPLPQAQFNPVAMFMSVLWSRIKRIFGAR